MYLNFGSPFTPFLSVTGHCKVSQAYCLRHIQAYYAYYAHKIQIKISSRFLPRDAMQVRPMSVCLSVCLSRSWIVSKWINISSNIFHYRVDKPFWFFNTKRHDNIPTGTPLTGVSNAGGVSTNRDSEPISGFIAMLWMLRRPAAINTIVGRYSAVDRCLLELVLSTDGGPSSGVSQSRCKSVYGTESHAPVNTPKRRKENNLMYAAVNLTPEYN